MGRSPSGNGFELVDRGGSDRIRWLQSPQTEKAKAQGLTLDRTLIGRQHTMINIVRRDLVVVSPIHNRLPTFVIPKGKSKLERVTKEQVLKFGDILVVGTYVFGLKRCSSFVENILTIVLTKIRSSFVTTTWRHGTLFEDCGVDPITPCVCETSIIEEYIWRSAMTIWGCRCVTGLAFAF